ncbi:hypothetical protein CICLE_v10033999mg [Citrus x clementina]|uniref:Uncharacterized protein n=1 Tax=Citrus clementina TaxID=85681 RepID=V4T8G7_CITCL|nr:hypothetical protein CICLE_v10004087mg [Citrus x clementina]ESR50529.1 hypothetical protein CICLE_v10033999mg [Citrus x clementina]
MIRTCYSRVFTTHHSKEQRCSRRSAVYSSLLDLSLSLQFVAQLLEGIFSSSLTASNFHSRQSPLLLYLSLMSPNNFVLLGGEF